MNNGNGREFGWDDTIENDGQDFILLEPGDYEFFVRNFERARFAGSEKHPACNKAILNLEILSNKGTVYIDHNLLLHTKSEWALCQFFRSIGQRQHGQQLKMDWAKVVTSHGWCKIGQRKWVGKDGQDRYSNQVEKFYDSDYKPTEQKAEDEDF